MYSRQLALSLWDRLISEIVGKAFVTIRTGAVVRKWSLILLGVSFWIWMAWRAHPFSLGAQPLGSVLTYPFYALFAADVFRHVVIAVLAFWVALRIAAIYLDDIFELKNVPLAAKFIRQSAFATKYNLIEIRDGKIAKEHEKSPIVLIGGPGMVRVYLENVALFEKIDGTPRVIAPTVQVRGDQPGMGRRPAGFLRKVRRGLSLSRLLGLEDGSDFSGDSVEVLEGFERLRSVIDLRDQFDELEVADRTRDGVRVKAENVRMVFSVFRENQEPTLSHPYPFFPEAIKKLVYDQPKQDWTKTMKGLIRRELANFIGQHSLNEFLAADNPPESPRPELTNLFYDFTSEFTRQAEQRGVELRWIGVGTWVTPDEIIPARHQAAWRMSNENLARGSKSALRNLKEESRLIELHQLVNTVPFEKYRELAGKEPEKEVLLKELTNAYREKLRAAYDLYEQKSDINSPEAIRLRRVLEHLARVIYHWLGS